MKKLMTKGQQEKKNRINQVIIGVILILVMLFSTLAFAFGNNSDDSGIENIEYKEGSGISGFLKKLFTKK